MRTLTHLVCSASLLAMMATPLLAQQVLTKGGNNPYTGRSAPLTSTYNPYTAAPAQLRVAAANSYTGNYAPTQPAVARPMTTENALLAKGGTGSMPQSHPFTGKPMPSLRVAASTGGGNSFTSTEAAAANPYTGHNMSPQRQPPPPMMDSNPYVASGRPQGMGKNSFTGGAMPARPPVNPYTNRAAGSGAGGVGASD
jgi:hypothetical protein